MEKILLAIINLQDKSTILDFTKSTYMTVLKFLLNNHFKDLYELHEPIDMENLLTEIIKHKKSLIKNLNEFADITEYLVDEINKQEKGDTYGTNY